MESHSVIR